jgi:manganese efflux pump family protein
VTKEQRLRISVLFATFEVAMPIVGLVGGASLGQLIGSGGDYLAIGVLCAFGLFVVLHNDRDDDARIAELGRLRGWAVIGLGISISIDELAIGLTLGLLRLPFVPVLILIGAQAFALSQLGLRLGSHVSERLRERTERFVGIVLICVGAALLIEKTVT